MTHALGLESYMEGRYDRRIGESYAAMERTNFYDAIYSPVVLLLDEITANLDAETEARVLEALRRASEGRTVLSISHRIYENLSGRTVEIKAGNQ